MADSKRDVLVVGGGISGLTVAFWLERAGKRVTLVEAAARTGGAITTHTDGPWRFELGPSTVLANNPAVGETLAAAGLDGRMVTARPAAKKRYLWKGGRLLALPSGPGSALTTPLLSLGAKLRVLGELLVPARRADGDESIGDFVRRRLGGEMLDYAVGPFVSGVYAGDPERLATRWAVPKIHALEAEHGGLLRGALARRKGPAPGGAMFSFPDGLAELPSRLTSALGDVRTGVRVTSVTRDGAGFAVETDAGRLHAARVVIAAPADVTATLLDPLTNGRSRVFADIPYAGVSVVGVGARRAQVAHPLDGFGFLVPRKEGLRLLGCLWPSSLFDGRAPDGHVAVTAILGGRTDPEAAAWDDARTVAVAKEELARTIGLAGEPAFLVVKRWARAIPQYELGHGRFVEAARAVEAELPGLHLAGNWLGGVSVADCIKNATALARTIGG